MMKKKLSMILIAVMLLTACGSDSSQDLSYNVTDNSQQESVSRESMTLYMKIPQTLHPLENKEETVDSVLRLMFLPLVDIDASLKAQPSVAESWTFSADGLTLNLNLNSGILWQNGTALTADDVVYTVHCLLSAEEGTVYEHVKDYVASCSKNGAYSVSIRFHRAFSGNIYALNFPVISQAYYQQGNVSMAPMGNGAYNFVSYETANQMLLTANTTCIKGTPSISSVLVKILDSKETAENAFDQEMIDIYPTDAVSFGKFDALSEEEIIYYPSLEYDFIGFQMENSIFSSQKLRQAVAYALPKEEIAESAYLQQASMTNTPISSESWLYEENVEDYAYDLTQAKKLLEEEWQDTDGDKILENKETGEKLSFTILCNQENSIRRQIAQKLAEELKSIGCNVTVEAVPYQTYYERFTNGTFDMIIGGWKMSRMADFSVFFGTDGAYNYGGYSSEETDALLEQANTAVNENQIILAYSNLQKKLAEDLPYISIAYRKNVLLHHAEIEIPVVPTDEDPYHAAYAWE